MKSDKKKLFSRVLRGVAGFFGAIVLIGLIWLLIIKDRPLGPPLDWPTETPTSQELPSATPPPVATEVLPTETATPVPDTPTPTPEPLCGGPASMLVMLVGTDNRGASYLYGLADTIQLARVDFVNARVTSLRIPRDLLVQIPEIAAHDIYEGKINQAYFYGTEGMGYYQGPGYGAGLLARTLEYNYGIMVDHYVVLNRWYLKRMIDTVGGIYVYVPNSLYPGFPEGSRYLNGSTAWTYASLRGNDNDAMRGYRQSQIMCGLMDQVLSPSIIGKIPDLISQFSSTVLTDLSLSQFSQLSCLGLQMPMKTVRFLNIPEGILSNGYNSLGQQGYLADQAALSKLLSDYAAGVWPPAGKPGPTPTIDPLAPTKVPLEGSNNLGSFTCP